MTPLLISVFVLASAAGPVESLTLYQAVALAQSHSFAVREAALNVDAAQAGLAERATDFLPRVSASVTANGFNQTLNPNYFTPVDPTLLNLSGESYSTDVGVSYGLLSSTRRLNWRREQALTRGSRDSFEAAKRRLVRDVASGYLSVVEADSLARLAVEDAKRRDNALLEARGMVEAGRRAEFEILRAEAENAAARARVLDAENNQRVARAELSRVVGVRLGQQFRTTFPAAPEVPALPASAEARRSRVLANRPEVRASAQETLAARLSQNAASRTYLPTLGLFANYRRDLAPRETDLTIESFSYGASLSVVFGDQAATVWRVRGARARALSAITRADRLKYELEVEAQRAQLNYEYAIKDREAREQALVASRRAFESTAERYRLGVATQTERIDADAALAQAESDDTRSQVALAKALWEVRYALGESVEVSR